MRKLLSIGFAACVALLTLGAATASAADTQNYTFANQTSGDSGTCGPDWANDTFTRVFKVYPEQNVDNSYRMVENFTSGHFTTIQGNSPESCEAGNTSQISAGVHGSMHGSEVIKVTGGTYSAAGAAAWDGNGGTAGFTAAAFGGSAFPNVIDYYFRYTTANSTACAKKWINSGTGNSGDIATICN